MTVGSHQLTLAIDGMTCASCVRRVERALTAIPGVTQASVNLATNQAIVETAGDATALGPIAANAVTQAGYASHVVRDGDLQSLGAAPDDAGWRVVAACALSTPLVAPMLLMPFGIHWMVPSWLQFVLSSIVLWGLGARFFVAGFKALRNGSATMDVLVAMGTAAAWGLSLWLWQTNLDGASHKLYFESAAVVVALVLLGKWLEARAKRSTLTALNALRQLRPETVMLKQDGTIRKVPLAQVRVGDVLVVAPGDRIAVDGTVVAGRTHVDQSMFTGESAPAAVDVGDTVAAGTLNAEGQVDVRTTAVGGLTALGRIVKLVETAQAKKAPIQQKVDRVAEIFVPAVIAVALITLVAWKLAGADTAAAILHAVSVLVIACPCALGLATPATLMVGTGLAAQRGILVRDAAALEAMRHVKLVAFDKTGTLTVGRPKLVAVRTASSAVDEAGLVHSAAALQQTASHPLALAVRVAASQTVSQPPTIEAIDVTAVPGRGVAGIINGAKLLLGSDRWMDELQANRGALANQAQAWQGEGKTISWLAVEHGDNVHILGLLAFGDDVKPEAAAMLQQLKAMGVRSVLISGDNLGAATTLARQVGIDDVRAPVLPEDKARMVAALKASLAPGETIAMVGDGINDAPALAAADVGVAMGTGTDIAMETAGLTLMRGDISLVAHALHLSRAVTAKVRQNLFWAFAYNAISIPLAAMGLLSPMVAGAAMALSSVSVVGNALLLKRWTPPR